MFSHYILRALDIEGNQTFYTGKAGMEWLSFDQKNAFHYSTMMEADRKAKNFNRMEPVHGYWFLVQLCELSPSS